MKHVIYTAFCLILGCKMAAQTSYFLTQTKGHSHNDYFQNQPFTTAFEARMASIEADVFLWHNDLYVAHTVFDIDFTCSFDALYLQPLVFAVRNGSAYPIQLVIDIKTFSESTLNEIRRQLARYPDVFNKNSPVSIVISGNRPDPSVWHNYPTFIQFDGRPNENYTDEQWERIALVSDNFTSYTGWFDTQSLSNAVCLKLKKVIDTVHARGKKIRFWKAPDTELAWEHFVNLGVDYINTDFPSRFSAYFNSKKMLLSAHVHRKEAK